MGDTALKQYDLSFIYVYLFSSLVILGLDSAASVFYFDQKKEIFNRKQVTSYAFILQVLIALAYLIFFYPFRYEVAGVIFPDDSGMASFWVIALSIIPGYFMFNYGLNILLWNRKKTQYVFLCCLQTFLNITGVFVAIVYFTGTITDLFYVLISSMTFCGLTALFLVRKEIFINPFPLNFRLVEKLVIFGLPFALTSFFRQVIPSIDRFFLLKFNQDGSLPQYILAVKLASFINVGFAAFLLAFTPYSLNKINHDDAEEEISVIFRIVSIIALTIIPVLLLFKGGIIEFFADDSYALSAQLLPIFLFGWAFDLFTNFCLLGVYKSQKSFFILGLLMTGTLIITVLDILLVPKYGIFGAASSFFITKFFTFLIAFYYLKKHFHIRINILKFLMFFLIVALCSWSVFFMETYIYIAILILLLSGVSYYIFKLFKRTHLETLFR